MHELTTKEVNRMSKISRRKFLGTAAGATAVSAFPHVWRDAVEPTNTLLVGAAAQVRPAALSARAAALPAELRPVAAAAARRLGPAPPGGEVYTDDRAPVEWLVDRSIVDYAARGK